MGRFKDMDLEMRENAHRLKTFENSVQEAMQKRLDLIAEELDDKVLSTLMALQFEIIEECPVPKEVRIDEIILNVVDIMNSLKVKNEEV